ncbi:MAG: hypothetical protein AVDCRST_MAG29-46, partial [uncultured Nocardioidaceae bacterium]
EPHRRRAQGRPAPSGDRSRPVPRPAVRHRAPGHPHPAQPARRLGGRVGARRGRRRDGRPAAERDFSRPGRAARGQRSPEPRAQPVAVAVPRPQPVAVRAGPGGAVG